MTTFARGRAGWRAASAALLAAAAAGCATPPPAFGPGGRSVVAPIEIAGERYEALWHLPSAEPLAALLLQPGFTRRCSDLQTTARQIMAEGLAVLCVDADMARGNPALADALADGLDGRLAMPDGRALPARWIVGGHSAGAVFALRVGARLDARAPARLAGALLLDPVAAGSFAADLQTVSAAGRRPVLAITAAPSRCNAGHNAGPALSALGAGFVGVLSGEGSNHLDAEGDDGAGLAQIVCGRPRPENVARLRALAAAWAFDLATGRPPR